MDQTGVKSRARSVIRGLLALVLAIGLMPALPATAWADDGEVTTPSITINGEGQSYDSVAAAIAAADEGDTIVLGPGEYGAITANKAVSFEGSAGAEETSVEGIYYDGASSTANTGDAVTVKGLTITTPEENAPQQGVHWANHASDGFIDYILNVYDCVFENWQFAIGVNSDAKNCMLNVSGTKLVNVFCGINISESGSANNKIGSVAFTDDSTVVYEVQAFAGGGSTYNCYYDTVEDCKVDANREKPTWNGANGSNTWPAAARLDNTNYETIQGAVDAATAGDEIMIFNGEHVGNVSINKELTLVGQSKDATIKFNPEERESQTYLDVTRTTWPTIYSTASLTLRNLTVAGPTTEHHGIDGVQVKGVGADLTVENVAIKDMRCEADGGEVCGVQYGRGILFEGDDLTVIGTEITAFQKQAIDASATETIKIEGNTITGVGKQSVIAQNGIVIRQGSGSVAGNRISGMSYNAANEWAYGSYGVLLYGDADDAVTVSGNTFEDIDNGIYADEGTSANIGDNTYVGGVFLNDEWCGFESAIQYLSEGDEIVLNGNVETTAFSLPAGVTLDGDGHKITCSEDYPAEGQDLPKSFITVGADANNVTIEDVIIDAGTHGKHAVQFYCNEGGMLRGVEVNGANWTSVLVNGATGVAIEDCTLDPGEGAYAHIEYSMGIGVTTVPTIELSGTVTFVDSPSVTQIWADCATATAVQQNADGVTELSQVPSVIKGNVTNNTYSDVSIIVSLDEGNDDEDKFVGVVADGKPQPSVPGGGGTAPSKPSYDLTVAPSENGSVELSDDSAEEGDEVTVTVKPDAGFELESISVTDEDGEEVELTENADGTYSFTMPAGEVTVSATFACDGGELCPSHGFSDVDCAQWYHDAIDWAVAQGVLNGIGGTDRMEPDGEITRAQMAQVLFNVEGAQAGDPSLLAGYADADASAWYAGALSWAVEQGIFSGWAEGGASWIDPEGVLTREQAAAVLMRWTGSNGGDVSGRADLSGYPDPESVSDWAVESMQWAVHAGVLSGVAQGDGALLLEGQGTATRAQTAQLMMRLLSE